MIDPYPTFIPQWTHAMEEIHKDRTLLKIIPLPKPNSHKTIDKARAEHNLDWGSTSCCLTGEAFLHKRAPLETCDRCRYFTFNSSEEALGSLTKFYEFKQELAEHMQKEHTETWDSWIKE